MISLVTCTGDRPECFARCEMYVRRFARANVDRVVVDDGCEATTPTDPCNYIRRPPQRIPQESFKANLRAGLAAATGEYIFVIEDDDWYSHRHVDRLLEILMQGVDVVGEACAKYYNVAHRRYRQLGNRGHASLCQTAFHRRMIPLILRELDTPFVDIRLWGKATNKFLFPSSESCVGLKGQAGRQGIGMGHHPRDNWSHDPDGTVLREWIGDDAGEVLNGV